MRTRRSTTNIEAYYGKHMINAASTTQMVIAFSCGESELYELVRGTDAVLGIKSMARDSGLEVKIALETESVSARGMSQRQVCREVARRGREATIRKKERISNDVDLLASSYTKRHVAAAEYREHQKQRETREDISSNAAKIQKSRASSVGGVGHEWNTMKTASRTNSSSSS